MLSTMMFATTAVFSLILYGFFPEWTWLPQTVEQTIAEGLIVIMLFASALMYKIEELIYKLDKKL